MSGKLTTTARPGDPFYYRYKTFFVGIFVLIPLVLILALFTFILLKSEIMEKRFTIYIHTWEETGLIEGAKVYIKDLEVGYVKSISLNKKGDIDIVLKIKPRYSLLLRKDSKAKLKQKKPIVGDWEISLTVGSNEYNPLDNGDTLPIDYSINIDHLVQQLAKMVTPLEEIFQSIANGEGVLKHLIGNDTLMPKTTAILNRVNGLFYEVDHTINRANLMINKLISFSDHGTATIDSIMLLFGNVDNLINRIDGVVVTIDTLVGSFGSLPKDATVIFDLLQKDLREAEILLKGIQSHWLLKRTMKKQRQLKENEIPH